MADKSDFGWSTVNEYLSDKLASNSDDEKRIYRAERRAERKIKDGRRRFRPADRIGRLLLPQLFLPLQNLPLQRVLSLIEGFLALRNVWGLALFLPSHLWRYSQAISNILQDLLAIFVSCFSINFW